MKSVCLACMLLVTLALLLLQFFFRAPTAQKDVWPIFKFFFDGGDYQTVLRNPIPKEFNGSRPTKLIIHGFASHSNAAWIAFMQENFFRRDPSCQVVVVDWREGSRLQFWTIPFVYAHILLNMLHVRDRTVELIDGMLERNGLVLGRIHCVGHSLGAHICGLVGKKRKLARITALDPANYPFYDPPGDEIVQKEDAEFVDAIHTDVRGFWNFRFARAGMLRLVGHADYYVNRGRRQPHFHGTQLQPTNQRDFSDHTFSAVIFGLSIRQCKFRCSRCASVSQALRMLCPRPASGEYLLGYDAHKYNQSIILAVDTGGIFPDCLTDETARRR